MRRRACAASLSKQAYAARAHADEVERGRCQAGLVGVNGVGDTRKCSGLWLIECPSSKNARLSAARFPNKATRDQKIYRLLTLRAAADPQIYPQICRFTLKSVDSPF